MTPTLGKFFWKIFLVNGLLLLAVVGTCLVLVLRTVERAYDQEWTRHLQSQAGLIGEVWRFRARDNPDQLQGWINREGGNGVRQPRLSLIGADGTILADSARGTLTPGAQEQWDEVDEAFTLGEAERTRWSPVTGQPMRSVAVRIDLPGDQMLGVVRAAHVRESLLLHTGYTRQVVVGVILVLAAAGLVLAGTLVRLWSRPLARITATAHSLSEGNLSARAPIRGSDEVALLGRTLNAMRDHLAGQLETNYRQRRTLESLQAQLHEGVIVVAGDGQVVLINPAAARLLGLPLSSTGGLHQLGNLTVERLIPHHELQRMLQVRARGRATGESGRGDIETASGAMQERRIVIERPAGEVNLLARATDIVLPGFDRGRRGMRPADNPMLLGEDTVGRLLVLTDITELSRTLQVKSDFVANASHELRTPLAAIRAAVETLLALDLTQEAAPGRRLLQVIERHCHRLEEMVRDLLDLSRLESSLRPAETNRLDLRALFDDARDRLAEPLIAKQIAWATEIARGGETLVANRKFIVLIVDNLLDNAVKFTPPGGSVTVRAEPEPNGIIISVEDTGCGIPPEEQGRVFERFYQVERARSGASRGTGLGLSIVRHAVAALGGKIELHSVVGQGTRLTVRIPQAEEAFVDD